MNASVHTTAMPTERRHSERLPYTTPVRYLIEAEMGIGTVKNISSDGMFLETHPSAPVGSLISIDFPLRHSKSRVGIVGKVARANRLGVGVSFTR
jgi:hypothetical protein